jgi:hypothetical protein
MRVRSRFVLAATLIHAACASRLPAHAHSAGVPEAFVRAAELACTWESERWPSSHGGVKGAYSLCMAGVGINRGRVGGVTTFTSPPSANVERDLTACAEVAQAQQRAFDECATRGGLQLDTRSRCGFSIASKPIECQAVSAQVQQCLNTSRASSFERSVRECLRPRGWHFGVVTTRGHEPL